MMFVDGFNLYHPLREHAQATGENHIKWLDLWALGERVAKARGEELVGVINCTAYLKVDATSHDRHQIYNRALRSSGVEVVLGHYMTEPRRACSVCGQQDEKKSEKQTDINVALHLYRAGLENLYDTAYLLSADSDQAATARHFAESFPNKLLVSVAPPNRPHSTKVLEYAHAKFSLTIDMVKASRFPSIIFRKEGNPIRCPREYDLPSR